MLSDCTMRKRTLAKRAPFGLTEQRVSVGDALGERAVEQLLLLLLLRPDHRGHTVTASSLARAVPLASGATPVALTAQSAGPSTIDITPPIHKTRE